MKGFQFCLLLLVAGCCLTGCKTTAILSANFESNTVGALPPKNLPGEPAGDEMTFSSELEPRIRIVASGANKALSFTQVSASGLTAHNQWLGFKGISTNFVEPMWFYFTAKHSGLGGKITIDITDGAAAIIGRFFISQSGDVSIVRNVATVEEQHAGNIPPDESHTFVVALNMSRSAYNLIIYKSSGNITVEDIPVANSALSYANPANPTISLRYDDGSSSDRKFVMEAVTISRKQP